MNAKLQELAALVRDRNSVAERITRLIGRPAQIGHIGEYIASQIFDIQLEDSAVSKGFDGEFRSGALTGRTVNVKFYAKREGVLDIRTDAVADYYLVLTGPKSNVMTSRGEVRPWHIESVFLFNGPKLVVHLEDRGVKIGIGTSVITEQWERAKIYPVAANPDYAVSDEQAQILRIFASGGSDA